MTKDLLIEIGTEELPPVSLRELGAAFAEGVANQLTARNIRHGAVACFCSPRRLAVVVTDVNTRQTERTVVRRGPSVAAAFGLDGAPTKALTGFARSCGVSVGELGREESEKGVWLVYRAIEPGDSTVGLIPQIVELALAGLPVAKRMRWGTGDMEFVRPVHWICLVFGDAPVSGTVFGLSAGGNTFGHRFHAPGPLAVPHAAVYAQLLRERGFVEPSFEVRRSLIVAQVRDIATDHGLFVDLPPALLDEVTALVEWPRAIFGSFDEAFLAIPSEVLIETMQQHQKYFPVRDAAGRLQARFVAIANIDSKAPAEVRSGNERVIRPRFADAEFFWQQDRRRSLESYFTELEGVVFQDRLGSVADRCRRVARLATEIAPAMDVDLLLAERAALLAKCDLVTSLVGEFPSLQGIMGRYYAEYCGEPTAVCAAIGEQYLPRYAGDTLPGTACGLVLSLADRLDLLTAGFGMGHRPTGTKDPYGLRRASIAVVRILVETPIDLDLRVLLTSAAGSFPAGALSGNCAANALDYVLGRLPGYYQEQGIADGAVEAVIAAGGAVISQLDRRIRAVQAFRELPEAFSLAAANKRISNILTKAPVRLEHSDQKDRPSPRLFTDGAERGLWESVCAAELAIEPLILDQEFASVLGRLAELRDDVDRFFDQVMVMCEDTAVRENRLILLKRVQALFLNVADISLLR